METKWCDKLKYRDVNLAEYLSDTNIFLLIKFQQIITDIYSKESSACILNAYHQQFSLLTPRLIDMYFLYIFHSHYHFSMAWKIVHSKFKVSFK